jgi:alpha-L-rhamnosidase
MHPTPDRLRRLVGSVTVLAMMFASLAALSWPAPAAAQEAEVVQLTGLKLERKVEPVGVDLEHPRFSWIVETDARDVVQEDYRIRVTSGGDPVWDSGVVDSERSFDVEYDGPALASATGYEWTVDVTTSAGAASASSSFRTGLMGPADWGSSEWIGAPPPADPAAGWTDYTAEFDFSIQRHAFGAFFRANGLNNALMWQVSVADGVPALRPHTKINGGFALLENKNISQHFSAAQLSQGEHTLSVTVSPGQAANSTRVVTLIDDVQVDDRQVANTGTMRQGVVGFRSNTHSGSNEQFTVHGVRVTLTDGGASLLDTDFTDGNPFGAGTLTANGLQFTTSTETLLAAPDVSAPLLRKDFEVDSEVANATYYVAAGGYADVTLNGAPISADMLSPGFTDYDDTVQYAATDVTDQLAQGDNVLGMELGRGFFGMLGGNVWNWQSPPWHAEPRARGVLVIEYADGSTERVVTDDTWRYHEGPTRFDDLYAGERYDASYEVPGWNTAAHDASTWAPVREVTGPQGELVNQRQQPIRTTRTLPAVDITEPVDGVYVVEFPNVIAGNVEYTVQGPAGTTIRAAHAEKLLPNGRVNMSNNGGFQLGFQTDYFTLAGTGQPETWAPKFSYKGFKYIEVTGWPGEEPPPLDAFTAQWLHTDAEETGSFDTSNGVLDGVHDIVVNTLYNNIHHIPTDTPMFEKNGWTGDAAVGAEMFMLNLDVHELFAKWMRDVHETREASGSRAGVPMVIAPSSGNWGAWGPSQPWHAAYVMIPYWLYQYGGDDRVMTELYDGMKGYVDLEFAQRRANGTVVSNRLGDWVSPTGSPAGGHSPNEDTRVEGTAYLYAMLTTMERTARHLGRTADADTFAARAAQVKTAFNTVYLRPSGDDYRGEGADANRYRQVHNVVALAFGLTPDEATAQRVADRLAQDVADRGYHLDTGTIGTKYLLPMLTEYGHVDTAYRVATQTTYPSWGYKLANGATTVWEHWSLESRSLGHYFLGTVDDWNYQYVAGIKPSQVTGYRDITIAPAVTGELNRASATTATPYGPVTSDWRRAGRSLRLTAQVPVGSTATIELPGDVSSTLLEGGADAAAADGVRSVEFEDGTWTAVVGSGSYAFTVLPEADPEGDVELELTADQQQVVRGEAVAGELTVSNFGQAAATDVTVSVEGDSFDLEQDEFQVAQLAADGSTTLDLEGTVVPNSQVGARELDVEVAFTVGGQRYAVTESLTWVTVVSGVTLSAVTATPLSDPDGVKPTTVTATVTNASPLPVSGALEVVRPGWTAYGPTVTVPAGESAQVTALVSARGHVSEPSTPVVTAFVDDDVELARATGAVNVTIPVPAAAGAVDHVDFGDNASETAHAVLAAPNSGANTEAGLTRRYAHSLYPGSWFSALVDVPAGEPFIVRLRETFDGAKTKEMNIYVDDVLVGRFTSTRPTSGLGSQQHQVLVEAPEVLAATADGKARVKFEFPTDPGAGFFDPSIADAWILEPAVDTTAPTVQGSADAERRVTLTATDDASGLRSIEYRLDGGDWVTYTEPFEVPGFAAVSVAFRATDISGNTSAEQTLAIAAVPGPAVTASVSQAGDDGWFGAGAELTLTSEAGASIEYRLDEGEWTPYAAPVALVEGEPTVQFRATSAAGAPGEVDEITIKVDATVPVATASVDDERVVTIEATDEGGSGVSVVEYRLGDGPWLAYTAPFTVDATAQTVAYRASDVAGNISGAAALEVPAEPGPAAAPEVVRAPTVTGVARVGRLVRATPGTWNMPGVTLRVQWLRDGVPMTGQTARTYRLRPVDLRSRIGVQVTATRPGHATGAARSTTLRPVRPAQASVRLRVQPKVLRPGQKMRVRVRVEAAGLTPRGQVRVFYRGQRVRVTQLDRQGRAVVQVRARAGRGQFVRVVYRGAPGISTAAARTPVRIR